MITVSLKKEYKHVLSAAMFMKDMQSRTKLEENISSSKDWILVTYRKDL